MALFGPNRKPVSDIVRGLDKMVDELEKSGGLAVEERGTIEAKIAGLQREVDLLTVEERRAGTIAANIRKLLDLDGDGEIDAEFLSPPTEN
jgi:hypothetical protein